MAQSFNIDFTLKSPKAYSLSVTKSTEGGVSAEYVSEKISEHNVSDTAHENRFSAYDLVLAGVEERTTTLENNQSELGGQVQGIQEDVSTLKTVVDEKADKETTYTKTEVDALIPEPVDAYTKTETNSLLAEKADKETTYTKTEVDALIPEPVDAYTKTETNSLLAEKADKETTYTKTEVDALIPEPVDAYTKTETNSLLAEKADKATTLSGYGITDGVTLTGSEEISNKTISNSTIKGELSLVGEEPGASFSVSFTGNTPVLASNDGLEVASNTLFDSVPSVKSDPGYSDLTSSNIVTKKATAQAVSEHNQDTSAHEDIREKTEEALTIAKKANIAKAYSSYESLVSDLNLEVGKALSVGQSIYIETIDVPDLWVKSVEESTVSYSYTNDSQFIEDVSAGTQIGFYKLAFLETQKVDLSNYAEKSTTLSGYGITDAYTKTETNSLLAEKADKATTLSGYGITDAYTKEEVNALIPETVDSYTKTETDTLLSQKQNTLTAGDNITISEDGIISATGGDVDLTGYLKNTATGSYSLTILGNAAEKTSATNVGVNSSVGAGATAVGYGSSALGNFSAAIGSNAIVSEAASGAIQLGIGTNEEAGSLYVGFAYGTIPYSNYKLLGSDGIIPAARLSEIMIVSDTAPRRWVIYTKTPQLEQFISAQR